jgi:hypothetical protein
LLAPISIAGLKKKFNLQGDDMELFGKNKKVGSSITFSYIVYSKKNMNKYIKQLKKNKISSLKEMEE